MAVRRTSTVAADARAAARARRSALQEERRKRDALISDLADEHAVALAMADDVRKRADQEIAGHLASADEKVAELLELGERVEAVAKLLGLAIGDVRAARRRVRRQISAGDGADGQTDAGEPARRAAVAAHRAGGDASAAA